MPSNFNNLIEVLEHWANHRGNEKAFTFLNVDGAELGTITYNEFAQRAQAGAKQLLASGVRPGDNVLLAYPAGLEFIIGLFACMYAGVLGAPIMFPKSARNRFGLTEAAIKIGCSHVLTATRSLAQLETVFADVGDETLFSLHAIDGLTPTNEMPELKAVLHSDAFIQFTSGSTRGPKALVVNYRSCLYNLRMAQAVAKTDTSTVFVSWLPHYHDLGLVAHILHTIFCGAHCVLLAPESVIVRPDVWLKSISRYRGTFTGAPDFAYRLCTQRIASEALHDIDLSSLRVAINAAEPIAAGTLDAFAKRFSACGFLDSMFLPSYGMAEATVLISSSGLTASPKILNLDIEALGKNVARQTDKKGVQFVGCGTTWLEQRIVIVNPETCEALDNFQIGEVWVSGENVLEHYLNDEAQTQSTFVFHTDNQRFLRTGDLGFLDADGELYITGRLKDLVIVRGANYYPQEIEHAVEACHKDIRLGCVAAFNSSEEGHSVIVVAELERLASRKILNSIEFYEEIIALSRAAVVEQTGLIVERLVFVKPGRVPRTTSGKVSRQKCKVMLSGGSIDVLVSHIEKKQNPNGGTVKVEEKFANNLLETVLEKGPEYLNVLTRVSRIIKDLLDIDVTRIDSKRSLFFYGADSVKMIELQTLLEKEFSATISDHDLFDATTFEDLLDNIVVAVTSEGRDVSAIILDDDVERYLTDLRPLLSANQNAPAATENCVLITGAAGFLGVYILAEVLRTSVSRAICLVRASDVAAGKKKVLTRMKKYGVQFEESWLERIEFLPGDVMDPLLGMEEKNYHALAARVSTIIHCAAIDNFYLPYTAIRRTNVDGTVNTLKFSLAGAKKRFLHISSCAASLFNAGAKDVDTFGLRNGYAQSKYVSEKIVLGMAEAGYSALSFRLGYLYHFGLTSLDDDDSFETLVIAMKEMEMVPDMKAVFDLVPIDHAAKCIIASEFSPADKPLYTYYNKVPLNWQDVVSYYRENHKEMQIVPLEEFVQAFHAFVVTTERPGVKLLKSVVNAELYEQINTMFLNVSVDNPPVGIEVCPPCNKGFVSAYLDDVIVGRGKIEETLEEGV